MGLGSNSPRRLTARGSVKNHDFYGTDKVHDLVKDFKDVLVYFDPDVDGVVSGYLVCKFLALWGIKYSWYINNNRSHDWSLSLESVRGMDIIAVDFLITEEKFVELVNNGCRIISLDHHENKTKVRYYKSESGDGEGVIVNNQFGCEDVDGRYLSGAGVVFETLRCLDERFDTELNRQLVGITLLSDIRDIENPLAEGYLYRLYTGKYKGYLRYLIDNTMGGSDYGFGVPRLDRNYVDYKFSPAINASLRFNQQDSVVEFFLGEGMLDLGYRERQKQLINEIVSIMKTVELRNLRVCYFKSSEISSPRDIEYLSNFVGYAASRFLDGDKSVICYLIEDGKIRRASFRGRINGYDYNSGIQGTGGIICRGHGPAFGVIGLQPGKELFLELDRICRSIEKDGTYQRKIIPVTNMSIFVSQRAFEVAEDNMYKLSQNQAVLRYLGGGLVLRKRGANHLEYEVDGIPITSFGARELDVNNLPLIVPIMERGRVRFIFEGTEG